MKKSSMFLCDTTNVDYAYIDEEGNIIGGSIRPKFIVTGRVDGKENVVVDFSTIKKTLKKLIDDQGEGFDHKLWWIEGVSKGTIYFPGINTVSIETPKLTISGPKNIVRIHKSQSEFKDYLTSKLRDLYPLVDIDLTIDYSTNFDLPEDISTAAYSFRYVHGLRDSTSWGCQNIAHGHLSYICAKSKFKSVELDMLMMEIATELDKTVFIWDSNFNSKAVAIDYLCERGYMKMSFKDHQKIKVLDTETTVEHLVEYVWKTWQKELQKLDVEMLYVSEGLSKGAVKFADVL